MQVPGALRICPNNLHDIQGLEPALAESSSSIGGGFCLPRLLATRLLRARSPTLVSFRSLPLSRLIGFLSEADEKPFRPTDVAEPTRVIILNRSGTYQQTQAYLLNLSGFASPGISGL